MKTFKNSRSLALVASVLLVSGASHAAGLGSNDFSTIQADITTTIGTAAAIGIAIMTLGLGWDVGMSLVKKFVKKGAK